MCLLGALSSQTTRNWLYGMMWYAGPKEGQQQGYRGWGGVGVAVRKKKCIVLALAACGEQRQSACFHPCTVPHPIMRSNERQRSLRRGDLWEIQDILHTIVQPPVRDPCAKLPRASKIVCVSVCVCLCTFGVFCVEANPRLNTFGWLVRTSRRGWMDVRHDPFE